MWFNQLTFYRINPAQMPDAATLSSALQQRPFNPCLGLDWFSEGWGAAASHSDEFLLKVRNALLLALKREDKVLPAGVIRDLLDAKVTQIEEQEFRKIGRKEKLALKEQITDDLLPRAFTRSSRLAAMIDTQRNWLMVDSATASKAENLLSCLRDASTAFPAALVHTNLSPQSAMTDWLINGDGPGGFALDNDCELKAAGDNGAVIRCSRQDLTAEEVQQHLKNGKQATKLGLVWRERIRFVLTESMQLKRLQFLDVIQEEAAQAGDDMASLNEATLLLMAEELGGLVDELIEVLGGEQK